MSVNTAHAPGGVLIFKGEFILLYCDGVELTFEGSDAHQFHGTKKGRIYLTTHRMVFTNSNSKDFLQSFSFPFFTMSNLGLEQPIFGANYIKGTVKAEQNGNWTGKCTFKLKFMKGGAIEFGQTMMEAGKTASQHAAGMAPPPYFPPPGPYYCPPPPAYTPSQGVDYGFNIPYDVFPDAPPANSVFMSDMLPPYPGVNGPPQYYPGGGYPAGAPPSYPNGAPPSGPAPAPGFNVAGYAGPAPTQPSGSYQSAAMAKAAEASQNSAYYNPAKTGSMYVPAAPPSFDQASAPPEGPPPPYSEGSTKTN
uniref:Putative ww domain binding protein wbp-2 n=1 Tax=Rhipicephalus microplus TaxID=6941 RepID=A0A6G5AB33_RHIMP